MPLAQTIGLDTLSKYFHLPINDVAKELGVCATVLKKICRKNGIPRWPHRKIKSLDKMIMTLEVSVAKNPEDGERIRHEIHTLKNKKMFLMKNPNVLATKAPSMKKSKSKGIKSPIESPESPSSESSPSSRPFPFSQSFNYLPPYSSPYPSNAYGPYGSFPKSPAAYGYPPYPYASHPGDHQSEECLSPSLVLDPVAAAVFLQIPHPHIPHPSSHPASRHHVEPIIVDKSQWVPGDHPSAFTPTKSPLHAKYSPPHPSSHPSSYSPHPEYLDDQARMVPSTSPTAHSQQLHSSANFLIHLPELRLPDEREKPNKLSTLEPELFHHPKSPASPASPHDTKESPIPPPSSLSPTQKWQLPEWFESEQAHRLRKDVKGESPPATTPSITPRAYRHEASEVRVPISEDATPAPLSLE